MAKIPRVAQYFLLGEISQTRLLIYSKSNSRISEISSPIILSQKIEAQAVVIIEVSQIKEKSKTQLFSIFKKTSIVSPQSLLSSKCFTVKSSIITLFEGFFEYEAIKFELVI
ncbi:TPA: hypothetical protein DEG21_04210 [Patescibacteria group bacterium]|nr:hypothetical protein [Candidatus Gracilibacteria bacterium]HBY75046.1 hypothetical protein [Candidatus Gracilibacteria bacterium]